MSIRVFLLLSFTIFGQLSAVLPFIQGGIPRDVTIELQEPVYKDGVLSTDKGGVIKGKDLYLQGMKINYIRVQQGDKASQRIEAEGDLLFIFKEKIYTGKRLEFNMDSQTGTIYDSQTTSGEWFIGAKEMLLNADGSAVLYNCTMTTSEGESDPWGIHSTVVHLSDTAQLKAKNVSFQVFKWPVFWIPVFFTDLRTGITTPLRYEFKYFGKHGPRLGLSYSFQAGENWKNKILLDISTTRGVSGGFETHYKNPESQEQFSSFNYYAYDIRTTDSYKRNRYRFQGKYTNRIFSDKVAVRASYDKLSDFNMPGDYINRGLDSGHAGRTELVFSRKEKNWISSLNAKVRINDFQTIKQQLPLFQFTYRPVQLGETGLILDSRLRAGYLDYKYASGVHHVHDFHSSRVEANQKLFRGSQLGFLTITPYAGYRVIGYGNSPQHEGRLLALASAGAECHTRLERTSGAFHQALEPYVQYDYVTRPTVTPPKHFLFDLEDGLYRQNSASIGARSFVSFQKEDGFISQLNSNLYAKTFFQTPSIGSTVPWIYWNNVWKATPYSSYFLNMAWDTQRGNLDHFNARSEFTVNENIAFAMEYRHRSSYSWRKVDHENFMIDTFRSRDRLRHSLMSDRRDTFLPHLFIRFTPNVSMEALSRVGWNRERKPHSYNEYEINLTTLLKGLLSLTFSFQHRKEENRYSISFSVGAKRPSTFTGVRKFGQGNYDIG